MSSFQMESEISGKENKGFNRNCSEMQLLRGFNDLCLGVFLHLFHCKMAIEF